MRSGPYTVKVLPLGDSLTLGFASTHAGWRGILYASSLAAGTPIFQIGVTSTPGDDAANDPWHYGQNGATCAVISGNANTFNQPTVMGADIAVVQGGTNDIATGSDAPTTATAYGALLDVIWGARNRSWHQIIAMSILRRLDGFNPTVIAANALLPAIIAGKSYASHVTYFDMYNLLADADYSGDGIHPLASGDTKIGNALWPVMAPIVARVRAAAAIG